MATNDPQTICKWPTDYYWGLPVLIELHLRLTMSVYVCYLASVFNSDATTQYIHSHTCSVYVPSMYVPSSTCLVKWIHNNLDLVCNHHDVVGPERSHEHFVIPPGYFVYCNLSMCTIKPIISCTKYCLLLYINLISRI